MVLLPPHGPAHAVFGRWSDTGAGAGGVAGLTLVLVAAIQRTTDIIDKGPVAASRRVH